MDTFDKSKLITCLLPKGQGVLLAERLKVEKDIDTANVANGRGFGMVHSISYGKWYEVDLMTLVVNQERAEEIFEWIYFEGQLDKKGQGFIYQVTLNQSTPYSMPKIEAKNP